MGNCKYYIHTPDKGFFESMGWNGITYAQSINGAFSFTSRNAAKDALESLPLGSLIIDAESLPGRMVEYGHTTLLWNRDARDVDGLPDRELLEELCQRVVDYHASSLKFQDCERGTPDSANGLGFLSIAEME